MNREIRDFLKAGTRLIRKMGRPSAWILVALVVNVHRATPPQTAPATPPVNAAQAYDLPQIIQTDIGEHQDVTLADQTRIQVNTSTTLHADVRNDHRKVLLPKGEAFFSVSGQSELPMVVELPRLSIRVSDGDFLARAKEDGSSVVAVYRGGVLVTPNYFPGNGKDVPRAFRPVHLVANQSMAITFAGGAVSRLSADKMHRALAWTDNKISLEGRGGETLADAAAEFNRYNRRQIVVDPAIASIKVGGTKFTATDVDGFLRAVTAIREIEVVDPGAGTTEAKVRILLRPRRSH